VTQTGIVDSSLTFELELGEALPTGQMDRERLKLWLRINEARLAINSAQAEFNEATACFRELLVAEPDSRHASIASTLRRGPRRSPCSSSP
jgi:hypothetical protein